MNQWMIVVFVLAPLICMACADDGAGTDSPAVTLVDMPAPDMSVSDMAPDMSADMRTASLVAYPVPVTDVTMTEDVLGNTEVEYTLTNTTEVAVDYSEVAVQAFDRDGEAVPDAVGEDLFGLADEDDLPAGSSRSYYYTFNLHTQPIKGARVLINRVVFDDGEEVFCDPGMHTTCVWSGQRD